jgi:hypothetical protein
MTTTSLRIFWHVAESIGSPIRCYSGNGYEMPYTY